VPNARSTFAAKNRIEPRGTLPFGRGFRTPPHQDGSFIRAEGLGTRVALRPAAIRRDGLKRNAGTRHGGLDAFGLGAERVEQSSSVGLLKSPR
jgi:hypothetical protein